MTSHIGIEIGGTKLQLVAGTASGNIVDRVRSKIVRLKGADGIREAIRDGLSKLLEEHDAQSIGVGFGGPVDHETGRVARSHQIDGWSGFELAEWLSKESGLPVAVDNDANVAALGEALAGAGRDFNPVFYVTLGSGVGGGLVVNRSVFHGAKPGESEIGHVRLDKSETLVEQRCSGWAVDKKIRDTVLSSPSSALKLLVGSETQGEARFLLNALNANDTLAISILNEVADDLAFGLSHVTQLMHPEAIILGGGLSLIGEPLRAAVEEHLQPYLMEVFGAGPKIALAGLGEDAVPVGALLLAATRNAGQ